MTLALSPAQRCQRFLDRAEQIRHDHVIAGVLALGEAAIQELYDGDIARSHDRAAARDEPLALLAEQYAERLTWLGLSVDRIRTAMRAWEVDRQLPPAAKGQLLPSQLRVLSVVPSPADRARLALQALDGAWTTAQTAEQVGTYRQETGLAAKGGRVPQAAAVKLAAAAQRSLARLSEPEVLGDPTSADKPAALWSLPLAQRVALRQELERVKAAAEQWLVRLG
jgi:hypothetical protein